MKNKNVFYYFFLVLLIVTSVFISQEVYSQPYPVKIKLQQPPPNQLDVNSLWKLTLDNTSGNPMDIYLEGYADELKDGRIVDGTSKVFNLPAGKKDFQYEDFKTGSVKWYNNKYEEALLLDVAGNVILSTIPENIGRNYENNTFLQEIGFL